MLPSIRRFLRAPECVKLCLCTGSEQFVFWTTFQGEWVREPSSPPVEPVGRGLGGGGGVREELTGKAEQGLTKKL